MRNISPILARQPARSPFQNGETGERRGRHRAQYIRWVQGALNRVLGLRLAVDGIVGPRTRSAVRGFQRRQGLAVDGIVGPRTERALIAATGIRPPGTVRVETPTPPAAPRAAPTLEDLCRLADSGRTATFADALLMVKAISSYHALPWRVAFTILEHEGGLRRARHADGVMQTTAGVRRRLLPRVPRPLKLALLGLAPGAAASEAELTAMLRREFARRVAVQIATGVQELKENLDNFNGYVALAYQAYNAGPGWAYYTVTSGRQKRRPAGITDAQWENQCRAAATLLHQRGDHVRVRPGVWQCDANIPAWFSHIPVYDRSSNLQLIAFKYLRSITECIRRGKPAAASCTAANHRRRETGSGEVSCRRTRHGALDKLLTPEKLSRPYREAMGAQATPIPDDGLPLKVTGGRFVRQQRLTPGHP